VKERKYEEMMEKLKKLEEIKSLLDEVRIYNKICSHIIENIIDDVIKDIIEKIEDFKKEVKK
jgi:hypothetical protein